MVDGLLQVIENLGDRTIKKKEFLEVIEQNIDSIANVIDPAIDNIWKYSRDNQISSSKLLTLQMIGSRSDKYASKTLNEFIGKLKYAFNDIGKELYALERIAMKEMPNLIDKHSLTARTASIMKIVYDINSITFFVLDLIDLLTIEALGERSDVPKARIADIENGLTNFVSILSLYDGEITKIVKSIHKVSQDSLDIPEGNETMLSKMLSKNGTTINFGLNNFRYNPIYIIRTFLVDREMKKYENLKNKQELIKTRILELRTRDTGSHNPKLSKEIEYYEDKIAKIERKIRTIEEN